MNRYTATLSQCLKYKYSVCHEYESVTGGAHTSFYHMLILYMLYPVSQFAVQQNYGFNIVETCSRVSINNKRNTSCARLNLLSLFKCKKCNGTSNRKL
jgi:hypothetical protein